MKHKEILERLRAIYTLEEEHRIKKKVSAGIYRKFYPKYIEERGHVLKAMPKNSLLSSNLENA